MLSLRDGHGVSEGCDDRGQVGQHISGQGPRGGERPTIGVILGPRHASQLTAIAEVHTAKGWVPVHAGTKAGDSLAGEGVKGVSDDQRVKAATGR